MRHILSLSALLCSVAHAGPGTSLDHDPSVAPVAPLTHADLSLRGPQGEASGTWFLADHDHTVAHLVPEGDGYWLGSVPVWPTGAVLVGLDAPSLAPALGDLPQIRVVHALHRDQGVYRLVADPDLDTVALSVALAQIPGVRFSHPDFQVDLVPHRLNDPLIGDAWHLDNQGQRGGLPGVDVGAFAAWDVATGQGQIVAVLDTGIDLDHLDLAVVDGLDAITGDPEAWPDPDYEGHGHGTAMAGVAVAIGDNATGTAGIAPDAQVLPIRMIGEGSSFSSTYSGFVAAVDGGASVLNNSWGFSARDCPNVPAIGALIEAFDYAETHGRDGLGTAVAMSLGNGGCDASGDSLHQHPSVISVGAASNLDRRIGYSNYGDTLNVMGFAGGDGRSGLVTTDVSGALGYNTAEDGDYWYNGSGTSSACASVSGVLALMFQANPRLTAAQARQVLCDTAVKPAWPDAEFDADGWSPRYGCGRVDAAAAVFAVGSDLPSVVLDPPGELVVGRARLTWTGQHPTGERMHYRVELLPPPPNEAIVVEVQEPALDLVGVVRPGMPFDWRVTPIDSWGDGRPASGEPFTVEPLPEETGTCSSAPVAPIVFIGLLLGLIRRRR